MLPGKVDGIEVGRVTIGQSYRFYGCAPEAQVSSTLWDCAVKLFCSVNDFERFRVYLRSVPRHAITAPRMRVPTSSGPPSI
jgi:hypothetical protein